MYAYDDARAYVVNSAFTDVTSPLWAEAQLLAPNGSVFANATGELTHGLASDAVTRVLSLPPPAEVRLRLGSHRTYFVALKLHNGSSAAGPVVSQGTYWLSTSEDVLDWEATTWYNTPCTAFADFRDLLGLGPARLEVRLRSA